MLKEFREFAVRGNIIDLAAGIVIGAAFGRVVTSFVNDILMPPVGLLVGKVDFSNLFFSLSGTRYASLAQAKAAGAPTINYGVFANTILDFVILSFAVFLIVRQVNRIKGALFADEKKAPDRKCPYCLSNIPAKATRCRYCTAELPPE